MDQYPDAFTPLLLNLQGNLCQFQDRPEPVQALIDNEISLKPLLDEKRRPADSL